IGPYRLRAEITAPDSPADRIHQEQDDGGEDQEAGEIIDLLRPQLDEEEVEAAVREVDQHGLAGRAQAAVPAHERQEVVDREAERHQRPFDAAEGARGRLRIDLLAGRMKRPGNVIRSFLAVLRGWTGVATIWAMR